MDTTSETELHLGYDASCTKCTRMAQEVEEITQGRLDVLPLSNPDMSQWRRQALGDNATWAPTLVEVSGESVRAWTGAAMGMQLRRRVGNRNTWQIAKALGTRHDAAAGKAPSAISRSAFMKGAVGALVGLSVLAARPRQAQASEGGDADHWLAQLELTDALEMSDDQLSEAVTSVAQSSDFERMTESQSGSQANLGTWATDSGSTVKGVRHQTRGGGQLNAVSIQTDRHLMLTYSLTTSQGGSRSFMELLEVDENNEQAHLNAKVDTGDLVDNGLVSAQSSCSSSSDCGSDPCMTCQCTSYNLACVANCCAPCAFACGAIWSCVGCAGVWCPTCVTINNCCTGRGCRWRQACA